MSDEQDPSDLPDYTEEEAAKLFVDTLISQVMKPSENMLLKALFTASGRLFPDSVKNWAVSLPEESREHLPAIVTESVYLTLFELLVLLDGASSGYPVDKIPSGFAVFLHLYEDEDQIGDDPPSRSIRINALERDFEDLHDMLKFQTERG